MARRQSAASIGASLRELGVSISESAKKELLAGAQIIANDAKSRIHNVSGKLSDSIKIKANKDGTRTTISADAKNDKGRMYGKLVEFWPGREHPFLYPAMDANRAKIKENIINAIREAVRSRAMS